MKKYVTQPKDYAANLIKYQKNVYSQNGEDGVLEEIFKRLKISDGWACEFGAWDGKHLSNAFNLVKNKNWKCVMIEADSNKFQDLLKTAEEYTNIVPIHSTVHYSEGKGVKLDETLKQTEIPKNFDLLSIDVDSCDYHIWKSLKNYNPKVVVIEHSGLDMYIIQREGAVHKKDIDGSTSFHPIKELGDSKNYALLCDTGNMFFIRKDLLEQINE